MTYHDLVNVEEFEKKEYFNQERGSVSFYCKDCKQIVETDRPDQKGYVFFCKKCKSDKIVIGTEEGLKDNYKLK